MHSAQNGKPKLLPQLVFRQPHQKSKTSSKIEQTEKKTGEAAYQGGKEIKMAKISEVKPTVGHEKEEKIRGKDATTH